MLDSFPSFFQVLILGRRDLKTWNVMWTVIELNGAGFTLEFSVRVGKTGQAVLLYMESNLCLIRKVLFLEGMMSNL